MSTFPNVLQKVYQMNNSGLNVVGQHLGYDWNYICEQTRDAGLHGHDGRGDTTVWRSEIEEYENPVVQEILKAIFGHYPDAEQISIVDDF